MALKRKLVEHLRSKSVSLQKFNQILNFALHFMRLPETEEAEFQAFYYKSYDQADMTGREKALTYGKNLTDNLSRHLYGETVEEIRRKAVEAQRAREEAQRKALEEKNARLEEQRSVILNLHQKLGLSAEKIAETLNLDSTAVLRVLGTGD
jgi:DNA-directed RNA polymerase specialized sigma24 family protein